MQAVERIKAAQEKSLRLMRMDSKLDSIAKGNRDGINEGLNESVNVQPMAERPSNTAPVINSGRMSNSASKLPREILESFQNNVIDDSNLLDNILGGGNNLDVLTEGMQKKQRASKPIVEEYGQQESMNVVQPQVDYPMIRMIVEDIVKKYTSALQKKVLSEGSNNGNELGAIMMGKTFRLIDKQGNVYEAVLKKITNLNENKK